MNVQPGLRFTFGHDFPQLAGVLRQRPSGRIGGLSTARVEHGAVIEDGGRCLAVVRPTFPVQLLRGELAQGDDSTAYDSQLVIRQ